MVDEQQSIDDKDEKQEHTLIVQPQKLVGTTPHTYDNKKVTDFLDMVFHTPLAEDAERLVYTSRTNIPRMPVKQDQLEKVMDRGRGRALYFNTSSCVPDHEGILRHKKDLFSALHVLVLDDVGTKIPIDRIPGDLPPTYIIETSAGNFQYGYVLENPITDVDKATAVIQAAALAGLTDSGGLMATKIVRLPEGLNGKPGIKEDFKVNITLDDGPYWEPDLLIERLRCSIDGIPVTWESIQAGDTPLAKKYHNKTSVYAQNADGVIDPVLEWLYENDMVLGDSGGDWVDIECPWCEMHTSGNNSAGYAPIGRGSSPNTRGFKCFHDHCKNRNTVDFILWMLANSDFHQLAIHEAGSLNAVDFALDPSTDTIWYIPHGRSWKMSGFRTMHNKPVWVFETGKEKPVKTTTAQLWLESPYRRVVAGAYHSPGSPPLFEYDGELYVNTFRAFTWTSGAYDMTHVQPFLDYLKYILPDDDERSYFIQWLSAQIQSPRFRGTGIIMQTKAFGTGRGTLTNMINQIMQNRIVGIDFQTLITSGEFNGWETAPLVVINEARQSAAPNLGTKGAHAAYETLKLRIDTSVVRGMVNEKYQPIKQVDICTSFLINTNHIGGVAVPPEDRRICVFTNPHTAADAAFFQQVYGWLDAGRFPNVLQEHEQWAWHVYLWLREQPTDLQLLSLPLRTSAKELMSELALPPLARICALIGTYMDTNSLAAISTPVFKEAALRILSLVDPESSTQMNYVTNCMNDVTTALQMKLRGLAGGSVRVRIRDSVIIEDKITVPQWSKIRNVGAKEFSSSTKQRLSKDMDRLNVANMVDSILDELQ